MRTITIFTHPAAHQTKIVKQSITHYDVWVREVAQDGKANGAVIRVLAEYFQIPKNQLLLLKGEKSKQKVIGII